MPLWRLGLDYAHSTGHGVGAYLGVHEGPHKIRKGNHVPLEPGMILSNEPGYYEAGSHGMRMENLMIVTTTGITQADGRQMLGFDALTMVPMDRRLIEVEDLAHDERQWIDNYHSDVFARLTPFLDGPESAWIRRATLQL